MITITEIVAIKTSIIEKMELKGIDIRKRIEEKYSAAAEDEI